MPHFNAAACADESKGQMAAFSTQEAVLLLLDVAHLATTTAAASAARELANAIQNSTAQLSLRSPASSNSLRSPMSGHGASLSSGCRRLVTALASLQRLLSADAQVAECIGAQEREAALGLLSGVLCQVT